jgi:thiamine biosynthesis lipoprotein
MSTTCRIIAVPPPRPKGPHASRELAARALQAAESALRRVEAEMSRFIDASHLSRLNRAGAGEVVPLPPHLLELLHRSRALHRQTGGTFDITCGPLIELWRAAERRGQAPVLPALEAARRASSWQGLTLSAQAARKRSADVRVDLGGIAKGYGIDRGVAALREAGMVGGLVDVGGDLRVFGNPPQGGPWEVMVRKPTEAGTILTLRIASGAVCTSGDYSRYREIEGKRYSHIIDPRTGWPASGVASATVLAQEALTADAWATALSVLGSDGLIRLPQGLEAMLIVGSDRAPVALVTAGMQTATLQGPPYPVQVVARTPALH